MLSRSSPPRRPSLRSSGRLAAKIEGATATDLIGSPFAWIGTNAEIVVKLDRLADEFGIDRYAVRSVDLQQVGRILGSVTAQEQQ